METLRIVVPSRRRARNMRRLLSLVPEALVAVARAEAADYAAVVPKGLSDWLAVGQAGPFWAGLARNGVYTESSQAAGGPRRPLCPGPADHRMSGPSLLALRPDQAAELLSAAARERVTPATIAADLAAGAPRNPDGTLNLFHYAAWLAKEER